MADRRIKHSGSIDDILQGFDGIQIKGEFHREPALQPTKSDDREDTPAPCARSTTTHVPQRPSTSCQPTHEPPAGQCTLPANRRSHISHMSQKSVPSAGTRTARDRGVVSGAGNAPKSVLPKVMRSTCGEASSIGGSRSDQDRAAMSYTDRGTAVTQQSSNLTEAFMRKKALKDAKVIAQMQAARAIRPT
ncbi:hypothetical protein GGG16DRAFT_107037, partial [Schizophyllum commune]